MYKWILLVLLYPIPAFAQHPGFVNNPPFHDVYKKPALNPYLLLSPSFDLPYQMSVNPLIEQERQQRKLIKQNDAIKKIQKTGPNGEPIIRYPNQRSTEYKGIRPTGHKTMFMFIP